MDREMINRVSADLEAWRTREERMEKLFSSAALQARSFRSEKLRYYEEIIARYGQSASETERLDLVILRQIRGRLEKELYPNLLLRWARRLLSLFLRPRKVAPKVLDKNYHTLQEALIRTGFNNIHHRLEQALKQGKQEFMLPTAYYVKGSRAIDIQLNFSKNHEGLYSFDSYRAILRSANQPGESRAQTFYQSDEHQYNQVQAYNLLDGRALQVECRGLDGTTQKIWQQLDFNDKDASGNFLMRAFQEDPENRLKLSLDQLPLKNKEDREKIWEAITNGDRVEAVLKHNGTERTVFIAANPQHRSVGITDEQNNQLSLPALFSKQAAKELKADQQKDEPVIKTLKHWKL